MYWFVCLIYVSIYIFLIGDSALINAVQHGDSYFNIVKALVQVGGAIYVQSSKGEDARIYIYLQTINTTIYISLY